MLTEVELRMDDLTFTQKGDFLSLFSSTTTFANQELAKFYGVPYTATDGSFQRIDLPNGTPRVGILASGAILAAHAHAQLTSPTLRGKYIDNMLLCETIPPPPPGVAPLPSIAPPGSTVRQVMIEHRAAAAGASCHTLMDPLGFGMENFDSTGSIGRPTTVSRSMRAARSTAWHSTTSRSWELRFRRAPTRCRASSATCTRTRWAGRRSLRTTPTSIN
jgi:hypothetical protein